MLAKRDNRSSNDVMNSKSRSSGCNTNVQNGMRKLNLKLRSVVMSETTFQTFVGFNNQSGVGVSDDTAKPGELDDMIAAAVADAEELDGEHGMATAKVEDTTEPERRRDLGSDAVDDTAKPGARDGMAAAAVADTAELDGEHGMATAKVEDTTEPERRRDLGSDAVDDTAKPGARDGMAAAAVADTAELDGEHGMATAKVEDTTEPDRRRDLGSDAVDDTAKPGARDGMAAAAVADTAEPDGGHGMVAAKVDATPKLSEDYFDLDILKNICSFFDEETENLSSLNFFEGTSLETNMLASAASGDKKETEITKAMASGLSTLLQTRASKFDAFREAKILPHSNRLDVAIGSDDRLLAFVEVGLTNRAKKDDAKFRNLDKQFWHKVDQALYYLDDLHQERSGVQTKEGHNLKVQDNGTILFAVIVLDRDKTKGRMAIFAAEPKGKDDYRVALMWRFEAGDAIEMTTLDRGYSAFINATMQLHFTDPNGDENKWRCLGPNCSKVVIGGVSSSHLRF